MKVLVTGATGYIGGRLVPRLLAKGHQLRVLVRDRRRLEARTWAQDVEIIEGSVEDGERVRAATEGIDAAYYLVHSMCPDPDSFQKDKMAARAFAGAAGDLRQIIYLGGIPRPYPSGKDRVPVGSRDEVGEILRSSFPTTEFQAWPIIGSGSSFFEMVQYLTERLPALAPRWIKNEVQPIAVRDVLAYLVAALGREDALGVIDVGSESITFRRMMLEYAGVKGIHRAVLPLPVTAPRISALWIALVTPIPTCLAGRLVRGIIQPVLRDTRRSEQLFPEICPVSYRRTVELALSRTNQQEVRTRWSDALGRRETHRLEGREGLVREVRTFLVPASREAVFRALSSLGGDRGWLVWNWAWRLRGFLDKILGGPGLRRGRRDPSELLPGDAVDFWRVEEVDPPCLLRLRAEMKVPGRAWLQWETREEKGQTRLIQTALFEPKGLLGWAYWYGSYPFHRFIFDGMVEAISKMALEAESMT